MGGLYEFFDDFFLLEFVNQNHQQGDANSADQQIQGGQGIPLEGVVGFEGVVEKHFREYPKGKPKNSANQVNQVPEQESHYQDYEQEEGGVENDLSNKERPDRKQANQNDDDENEKGVKLRF